MYVLTSCVSDPFLGAAHHTVLLSFPILTMGKKVFIVEIIKFTVNIFPETPIEIYKRDKNFCRNFIEKKCPKMKKKKSNFSRSF